MTKAHIRRGARPGEDWEQARERLEGEAYQRHRAGMAKMKAEYYDLTEQLFRMVYGMGPKYPPAEAQLRARIEFVKRRAWKRYRIDNLYPVWC